MTDTSKIIRVLEELALDLPDMYTPDVSENYKENLVVVLREASRLLRNSRVN